MEEKIEETKRAIIDKLIAWLEKNTDPEKQEIIFPHEQADNGFYAPTSDGGEVCILSVGLNSVFEQLVINRDIIECDPLRWDLYEVERLYLSTLTVAGVSSEKAILGIKEPMEGLFKWFAKELSKAEEIESKDDGSFIWHSPSGDVVLDLKYDWMYTEDGEPILNDPRPEDIGALMTGADNPLQIWSDAWRASQKGRQ